MDHELGSISPGKCADIVFLKSLEDVSVCRVLINGDLISEDGKMTVNFSNYEYPPWAINSVHIAQEIRPESFIIKASGDTVKVRAIEVSSGKVENRETIIDLMVSDGCLHADISQDALKAFVFERHHKTGTFGFGFVKGFGIKSGAMASTVAHDAHNLLVVGTNDWDMALAANTLIQCGGGMVVVSDGKVLGCVPLPIAGLISNKPASEMAELVGGLENAWAQIGCHMVSPFMTMALIPLACIPKLRLTNRGLVDCTSFSFVPLVI